MALEKGVILILGYFVMFQAHTMAQENYIVEYSITEESSPYTFGNLIRDTDIESLHSSDQMNSLRFSILGGSGDLAVSVGEVTGDMMVVGRVDRDVLCPGAHQCTRAVDVSVQSQGIVTALVRTAITVVDINDITPHFPQESYSLTIAETASLGRTWNLPIATDDDSPANGILDYRLEQESDVFDLNVNQEDGLFEVSFVLRQKLDRESQASHNITLLCLDPQNAGRMSAHIIVRDSNDNAPVFVNASYETEIFENYPENIPFLTISATDIDIGENGQVRYRFDASTISRFGNVFHLDEVSGELTVRESLDFEVHDSYRLVVIAHDLGADPQQTTARVLLTVLDINDCVPQVRLNAPGARNSTAHVIEGTPPGSFVAQLLVSDADSGENGRVTCTLNDNVFQLQKESEIEYTIQTASELDRETADSYNLAIMCQDHGEQPQTVLEQLTVIIDDVNDHNPTFSREVITVSLAENSGGGTLLTDISASDADTGINAELTYSLSANVRNSLYVTTVFVGVAEIRTIGSFDRESTPRIEFTLTATDGGVEARNGSVLVVVNIDDVNDEPPRFTPEEYTFVNEEEQLPFIPLGTVFADDPDSFPSNVVMYSLNEALDSALFDIGPQDGVLKSKHMLDRETQESYNVVVIATDSGAPPLSSSVTVTLNLIDVNDNAPMFAFPIESNKTVVISSDHQIGSRVVTLQATDIDSGAHARVTYIFDQAKPREFTLDSETGVITLTMSLNDVEFQSYTLRVAARDQGTPFQISSQTLYVNVTRSQASAQAEERVDKPNETAVIAVGCVGGALIVILSMGIVYIVCRRRRAMHRKQQALHQSFVTIEPTYAHKQHCVHSHDLVHEHAQHAPVSRDEHEQHDHVSRVPSAVTAERTVERTVSLQDSGIDCHSLPAPQEDAQGEERDTSSAEGSNADSGRGASELGDSQSHGAVHHMLAQPHNNAPGAQFTDNHLGFESPGRRLLYNKTGIGHRTGSGSRSRQNPMSTPSPLSSVNAHIDASHNNESNHVQRIQVPTINIQRVDSYRSDNNPVQYLNEACSNDVYV